MRSLRVQVLVGFFGGVLGCSSGSTPSMDGGDSGGCRSATSCADGRADAGASDAGVTPDTHGADATSGQADATGDTAPDATGGGADAAHDAPNGTDAAVVPYSCAAAAPPPAGCPDPPAAGVPIYYACDCGAGADPACVPGDDTNPGTSAMMPWRSFEQARSQFASLPAGGRILFCQGGAFTIGPNDTWINSNCLAGNRCVVASYPPPWGSGNEPRPIITATDPTMAGISFADSGNPDHEEGYVFAGLELVGAGASDGFFVFNDIDDVLLCDLYVHNFNIGIESAGANSMPDPGADMRNERTVLRDSTFSDNAGDGWLGGDNGDAIMNCQFQNNGFARAILNHNIYVALEEGSTCFQVTGNDLYQSALVGGQCQGTSMVAHGVIDQFLIEGNTVHEDMGTVGPGCWGIAVVPGYATTELFTNVTIRGNTVTNVGNQSIGVASCQGCVIENNVVINQQNINAVAIAAPATNEGTEDATDNNVTIRNNSLLIDTGSAIGVTTEGTGHVVVNNAIYSAGGGNGGVGCFNFDLPPSAYSAVDYNVCFDGGHTNWVFGQGTVATLANWSMQTGFDQHSQLTNPEFTSIVAPFDLSPAAMSPLVNAGDPNNASMTNFTGQMRGSPPNIGAY